MDLLQRLPDLCFRVDPMRLVLVCRVPTFKGAFVVSQATMEPRAPGRYHYWRQCLVLPMVSHPWGLKIHADAVDSFFLTWVASTVTLLAAGVRFH